jgi:hypothetical protein
MNARQSLFILILAALAVHGCSGQSEGGDPDAGSMPDAADASPPDADSCTDERTNNSETDTDCGGPCAKKCAQGEGCDSADD